MVIMHCHYNKDFLDYYEVVCQWGLSLVAPVGQNAVQQPGTISFEQIVPFSLVTFRMMYLVVIFLLLSMVYPE